AARVAHRDVEVDVQLTLLAALGDRHTLIDARNPLVEADHRFEPRRGDRLARGALRAAATTVADALDVVRVWIRSGRVDDRRTHHQCEGADQSAHTATPSKLNGRGEKRERRERIRRRLARQYGLFIFLKESDGGD